MRSGLRFNASLINGIKVSLSLTILKFLISNFPSVSLIRIPITREITSPLCNELRDRMTAEIDGGEKYFCIDSRPIDLCRPSRSKRCSMGKKDFEKASSIGYCTLQGMYYYGYKLYAVCGLNRVIHTFDLTKASVHDIHYLKDVKVDYSNCTLIGDRGYISAQVQLDLFETAHIRLEVPYRANQKDWEPTYPAFAKTRKRIETSFSQLCD